MDKQTKETKKEITEAAEEVKEDKIVKNLCKDLNLKKEEI